MMTSNALVWNGSGWDRLRIPGVWKDQSAVTISTIATLWTPASGKKIRFMGGVISVSAAGNVLFEDNAAGGGNFLFRTPKLAADTPYNFTLPGNGALLAAVDRVLKATLSTTGTITGTLFGCEE
jgi:hypothetical protein